MDAMVRGDRRLVGDLRLAENAGHHRVDVVGAERAWHPLRLDESWHKDELIPTCGGTVAVRS
jgi:hypothetical protein